MIHTLFDLCMRALDGLANWMDPWFPGGMDYVKINVIIFCFIGPALFAGSVGLNVAFILGLL